MRMRTTKCGGIASKQSSSASIEGNYARRETGAACSQAMRQSSPSARVSLALENAHKTMHAATDDYYRRNTTSDSPPSMGKPSPLVPASAMAIRPIVELHAGAATDDLTASCRGE